MTDAKDPVCGMTIKEKDRNLTSSHKGVNYCFCSEKCKSDFDKDPDAVLAMEAAREKTTEKERSVSLEKMIDEAAHEMRNPLTAIGGFTRMIYRRLPENDPNKEYMKIVIENVDRLENMIRQLVVLNTTDLLHPERSNVNNIIKDAVKFISKELKNKKIEIKLDLMDKLPIIHLDSNRIMTAIVNLVKNAVDAIEAPPGSLKISTSVKDGSLLIEVSDTGKGIPVDKIKYIFDPLFTSKIYGPGLGLTFTKRIIQEHNGSISVQSKPGKGTTFTIRLPLKGLN